ncbi:S24 family peptidase [Luteolibacter soli]|uniref:S24 family peptidase n=1 Tax=Luteolibacter soli TaxID=3135280 RepID=A0ABU9AV63_9BACT
MRDNDEPQGPPPADHHSFREWMDQNRLRAEDVAGPLQVSEQTIHNWRSSGIPARRLPHVQAFMTAWIDPRDRETDREPGRDRDATTGHFHTPTQVPAELRIDAFIMRPAEDEFDDWNRAANASGLTVREWITDTLDRAAREFKRTGRLPGEQPQLPHHDLTADNDLVAFPQPHKHPRSNKRTAATSSIAEESPTLPSTTRSRSSSNKHTGHWIDLHGGVAAGAPITSHIVQEPVATRKSWPDDHYALRVFGQSMEPRIPDGSLIIVKHWPTAKGTPKKGTIVVYSDGTGSTLKEFGYRKAKPTELTEADAMGNIPVLRSLNKSYPEVQTLEDGKIHAILVEVG